MAGSDGGTTILETPPYVIALVLFFFLVISLGFEKIVHLVRHALQKRGKQGLLSAMTNMQNELMCLGLATLILILFQSSLTNYCMSSRHYTKSWLDHVKGCSCCLTRTKGVSACYFAAKSCVTDTTLQGCCNNDEGSRTRVCTNIFDTATDWDVPNTQGLYTVNTVTGDITSGTASGQRRLQGVDTMRALLGGTAGSGAAAYAAEEGPTPGSEVFSKRHDEGISSRLSEVSEQVQCDGRVQTGWEECHFRPNYRPAIGATALHQVHMFIFITAIVHIVMGVILIVVSGLRLHFWRKWRDNDDANSRMIQQAIDEHSTAIDSVTTAGKLESQDENGGPALDGKAGSLSRTTHPTELPAAFEIERGERWRGRPEALRGPGGQLWEALVCFGRTFLPTIVTREEFSLMRSAFMLTHNIRSGSNFRFLSYLRAAMEDDFSHVVGLGLPMWLFIIAFILLSSAIGWCIWVFVIVSGVMLAVVNTKLIWIARYAARGGHVHRLEAGVFWLNRPWLLLHVIKFLLFFVSYVYANAIFFAAEFGSNSCFFSRVGFQGQPVPFWVLMVINTIFVFSLSLLTLPLYSITVQMGGTFKAHLLPEDVVANAARIQGLQASGGSGFRQMLSGFLPREMGMQRHESGPEGATASLVKHAAPVTS